MASMNTVSDGLAAWLRSIRIGIGQARTEKNVEGWGLTHGVACDVVWRLLPWCQHKVSACRFGARNGLLPGVTDPTLHAARRNHHDQRPCREMYLATLDWATLNPSLRSSP
jgi:hypothetical protein